MTKLEIVGECTLAVGALIGAGVLAYVGTTKNSDFSWKEKTFLISLGLIVLVTAVAKVHRILEAIWP